MPTATAPVTDESFAWASPALRARLLDDPAEVLKERGVGVPVEMPLELVREFARIALLLWVDGTLTSAEDFRIDPADEGLLFGRGVWESTRTVDGLPWLWNLHLDRLKQSAAVLGIDVAPERLPDAEAVRGFVRGLTTHDVVVRLNVTAGRPGGTGVVWMSAAPLSPHPEGGLRLRTVRNPVQKGQPYLELKTFQYATRLRIGQEAAVGGYDTALMVDDDGHLLEAAQANLFVRLDDGWFTPVADGGFLPGTVRHALLSASPIPIRERKLPMSVLGEVREAFVTNSNLGVAPVVKIDSFEYPVGTDTRTLQKWIEPAAPGGVRYLFVNRVAVRR